MGLGEKYGHVMCPLSKLPLQTQAFFQITLHAKQCQQQGTARAPQARPTAPKVFENCPYALEKNVYITVTGLNVVG